MKTITPLRILLAVLISALITRSVSGAPACCDPPAEEVPACCAPELPALAEIPAESIYQLDFIFTADDGTEHQLAELQGKPLLMAMFFAQCGYACPMLVHDMKDVFERLPPDMGDDVNLLLVTFDTDRDSVEALHAYRMANDLDARWKLWRATPTDTRTFAMVVGVQYRQEPSGDFSHSNLITLLDTNGVIAHRRTGLQGGLAGLAEASVRVATTTP